MCCVTDTHSWNNFILNSYSRLPRTLNSAENKILRHGCSHDTVNKVYELSFQIKNDVKITMFQFKVVENMLATKANLFRTQICDCNVCPQCLNTLLRSHVLSLLLRIVVFWRTFQIWWTNVTGQLCPWHNQTVKIMYGVFYTVKLHTYKNLEFSRSGWTGSYILG